MISALEWPVELLLRLKVTLLQGHSSCLVVVSSLIFYCIWKMLAHHAALWECSWTKLVGSCPWFWQASHSFLEATSKLKPLPTEKCIWYMLIGIIYSILSCGEDKEVTNNNPAKVATPDNWTETELRRSQYTKVMNIWPSTACHWLVHLSITVVSLAFERASQVAYSGFSLILEKAHLGPAYWLHCGWLPCETGLCTTGPNL